MRSKLNMEYPIVILQDESRREGLNDENKQALDEAIEILRKANKGRERAIKKYWKEQYKPRDWSSFGKD